MNSIIENPAFSGPGMIYSLCSMALVTATTLAFVLEKEDFASDGSAESFFYYFDFAAVMIFTTELAVRFAITNDRWCFVKNVPNIIDFLAVLPFYITIGLDDSATSFTFLRAVRLARVFRIMKFGRYATGIQMFGVAIAASRQQLVRFRLPHGHAWDSRALCPSCAQQPVARAFRSCGGSQAAGLLRTHHR